MEAFILVLELLGTLAFAASGAMTGIRKNMDIFGVCILGLTTAVGGGVIRDLILGNTPPATFQNPIYAAVAVATSLVLFLPRLRHLLMRSPAAFVLYKTRTVVVEITGIGTLHMLTAPLGRCRTVCRAKWVRVRRHFVNGQGVR